jgi:hypothetical protein
MIPDGLEGLFRCHFPLKALQSTLTHLPPNVSIEIGEEVLLILEIDVDSKLIVALTIESYFAWSRVLIASYCVAGRIYK